MSDPSTALVPVTDAQRTLTIRGVDTTLEPTSLRDAHWLSEQLANGEATGRARSPGSVLAIIMCGRELGLTAMQSVRGIHLYEGKPQLSSDLVVALIRRSPLCRYFRPVEVTDKVATYESLRVDEAEAKRWSFSWEDAVRAGLVGKDNWKKYPRAMLRARCITEFGRAEYPEVLFGIYVEGELEDVTPAASAPERPRIVDAEVVQPIAPEPAREATTRAPAGRVTPQSIAQAVEEHKSHAQPERREGWTGKKCPKCAGHGVAADARGEERPCRDCGGTGDEYGAREPQLTPADIAASVDAAPPAEDVPPGLELRPAAPGEEVPASSLSPEEQDQLACDEFCTRMMAAKSADEVKAIAAEAAVRFPDKANKHRALLGKQVYPRAMARHAEAA